MDKDSELTTYGKHHDLVMEIIEFARNGDLLNGIGPPAGYAVHVTHDFFFAKDLPYYIPPEFEEDESYLIWKDIIENEEAKFFCVRERDMPHFRDEYRDNVMDLANLLPEIIRPRLQQRYGTGGFDIHAAIGYALASVAHHRAVFGLRPDSFFERLFDLYKSGGYPCGWDGIYPEGRFIVYYPPAEELAQRPAKTNPDEPT